jgi:flavin reductase (DIM6/NTAB) family NADH-FMN oxidoreductase RutF
MKVDVPLSKFNRLINHGPVVLVTSVDERGKANIITLAWQMPVSRKPPRLAISVARGHYSHELIRCTREFVVNVPGADLLPAVWYCGKHTGRSVDKFEEAKLTSLPASKVRAPLIGECFGHLECRLVPVEGNDHTIFIGEVLAVSADEGVFGPEWVIREDGPRTLHHLGGDTFTTPGERLKA